MSENISMVLPCKCPHCEEEIVVAINLPLPLVDIGTQEDFSEKLNIQNDITENPEA